ncbi:hypothetical protein ACFY30_24745 [Streptomyces sp. NPDC000345]|uniref:hypothetical protein n=1 Tax=Streptomyces sp. NPDC000345 TaxID=3364537 RepID=UPI0036BFA160
MEVPTALAGYAMPGHGIVPAEHHLGLPGFWPAHLGAFWGDFAYDPEPFGADAADVDAALEALHDTTRVWPAYRIPLPLGQVWIVHRNLPGDPGVDYLRTDPRLPGVQRLASIDGHCTGPGLSWPDLLAVADAAPPDGEGVRDPDQRLLLLLPAHGDADTPVQQALERLAAALVAVGLDPEAAPGAAERLRTHPLWESPSWDAPGSTPLSGGSAARSPVHQSLPGRLSLPSPSPGAP